MLLLFAILIIIASVVLGFIILIQNPKGGGLSASLSGFSNQIMGVKQTTDVLEKGTWIFAAVIGLLCILSPAFIKTGGGSKNNSLIDNVTAPAPAKQAAPQQTTVPMPGAQQQTPVQDTNKR